MSLSDLDRFYNHLASWLGGLEAPAIVDFVWHGGEPLLNPPSYFEATFAQQRSILGREVQVCNTIQTNLTVLDQKRIDLLHQFHRVGVSIDLFGELRSTLRGQDSVRRVLENMDRLHANGIDFGCITVLSARNAPSIRKIVRFYHDLGVRSVRLLPLIDGAHADQHLAFDTTPAIVIAALQEAYDELVALKSGLIIEPLVGYTRQVIHHHTPGASKYTYNKAQWESVYLVDTNGDAYSYGNAYDRAFCHGNVFRDSMAQIHHSIGHRRAIEAAELRMAEVCRSCRFFGSCSGYAMAEEAPLQQRNGTSLACEVDRPMLEFVEHRLTQQGAIRAEGVHPDHPVDGRDFIRSPELALRGDIGIRTGVDGEKSLEGRISLSAGTTSRVARDEDDVHYISSAMVPRTPFRSATLQEMELLARKSESPWHVGGDVAVVQMPAEVVSPLMAIFEEVDMPEAHGSVRDHTLHPEWQEAFRRVSDYVKSNHALDGAEPRVVRVGRARSGKLTVTKDTVKGRTGVHYVGLHVDSWVDIPLCEREHSQNRICINLGRGTRQFLFINLGLARMHEILHGRALRDSKYYGSDLGHAFMRAFPAYPAICLSIRPGEAYIAPTENMIHDGSTLGATHPDVALHMIGNLAPRSVVERKRASFASSIALRGSHHQSGQPLLDHQ